MTRDKTVQKDTVFRRISIRGSEENEEGLDWPTLLTGEFPNSDKCFGKVGFGLVSFKILSQMWA